MVKTGFTPSLLVGIGELGAGIIQKTRELTAHWSPSLQELIQTVQIDKACLNTYRETLREKISVLRAGWLLQQAEILNGIQIRRQFGPVEINVYLLGQLGESPGGESLDVVFRELQALEYSWSPEQGYTGATITTLAVLGGHEAEQQIVLERLLQLYQSEEFLDSFAGRILLVDRVGKDGSRLNVQDLMSSLARILYISLAPGDESLLLPELGLIRKQEKETKLATVGIACTYLAWREQIFGLVSNWLEQQTMEPSFTEADTDSIELFQALEIDNLEDFFDETRASNRALRKLLSELPGQIDRVLSVHGLGAAKRFLTELDGRIQGLQQVVYDECLALDCSSNSGKPTLAESELPVISDRYPTPIIVEEYDQSEPRSGRVGHILLGLVGLAAIYRLTANQLIPVWAGWSLAGGLLFFGAFFLARGQQEAYRWEYQQNPRESIPMTAVANPLGMIIPVEEKPDFTRRKLVLDRLLLQLGDLLRESNKYRKELECLGKVFNEVAGEMNQKDFSLLGTQVEPTFLGWKPALNPVELVPKGWRNLNQSQLKETILKAIIKQLVQPEGVAGAGEILLQYWRNSYDGASIEPLLLYRNGGRRVRKLFSLACSKDLRDEVGGQTDWRVVDGPGDMVCGVHFYFGIDTSDVYYGGTPPAGKVNMI